MDIYALQNGEVRWASNGSTPPSGISWAGVATQGADIYIIGGRNDTWTTADGGGPAMKYNFRNQSWTTMPNLKGRRDNGPSVFILGNKIYAAGGHQVYYRKDSVDELDLDDVKAGWTVDSR